MYLNFNSIKPALRLCEEKSRANKQRSTWLFIKLKVPRNESLSQFSGIHVENSARKSRLATQGQRTAEGVHREGQFSSVQSCEHSSSSSRFFRNTHSIQNLLSLNGHLTVCHCCIFWTFWRSFERWYAGANKRKFVTKPPFKSESMVNALEAYFSIFEPFLNGTRFAFALSLLRN